MATSIFSRKRDLIYLIYFCISVPMMFSECSIHLMINSPCLDHLISRSKSVFETSALISHVIVMDFQPLYPPQLIPTFMTKLGDFYVDTYKDRFFIKDNTPPFLKAFLWSEVLYQFPTGLWAIQALLKGKSIPTFSTFSLRRTPTSFHMIDSTDSVCRFA